MSYLNAKILTIFLFGVASGLPLALTASTLTAWLFENGISKAAIGIFALVGIPYSIKFLIAPFMDGLKIPVLTKLLGRRRSWILIMQILLILTILFLGTLNPANSVFYIAITALLLSSFSAMQDIVIDAFRVESMEENKTQGEGAAVFIIGYRIGMLISSAVALVIADIYGWRMAYYVMGAVMLVGVVTTLLSAEPTAQGRKFSSPTSSKDWILEYVVHPITNFTKTHNKPLLIITFIILYKFGDAFAGVMTTPFLLDIGFTKTDIATIVKTYGLFATIIGSLIGGLITQKFSFIKALFICGILQMLTNLLFSVQAMLGNNDLFLILTIGTENLAGGMGTAAFVAYLSHLCNIKYTATQFAVLTSFASMSRIILSSTSGITVSFVGWFNFFIISAIVAIPALILLTFLPKTKNHDNRNPKRN